MRSVYCSTIVIWTPTATIYDVDIRLSVKRHCFQTIRHWAVKNSYTRDFGTKGNTDSAIFVCNRCYLACTS